MSVYSHIVARGDEVVFPKDTSMEIRFGTHESKVHPSQQKGADHSVKPPASHTT
jgi:hypothetical protein